MKAAVITCLLWGLISFVLPDEGWRSLYLTCMIAGVVVLFAAGQGLRNRRLYDQAANALLWSGALLAVLLNLALLVDRAAWWLPLIRYPNFSLLVACLLTGAGMLVKYRHRLFRIDMRSLFAFRICLAGLVSVDLLQRLYSLEDFYSADGVLSPAALQASFKGDWLLSLNLLSGHDAWQTAVFIVTLAAAVLMTTGRAALVASVLTWLGLLSVHGRNPALNYGADDLLRMALFFNIFLAVPSRSVRRMAVAGLYLQLGGVYLVTSLAKAGDAWLDGSAVWYTLQFDLYSTPLATHLRGETDLLQLMSRAVYWFELAAPLLLFIPLKKFTAPFRLCAVAGLVMMQLGFGLLLEVQLFPWVSSLVLTAFLPPVLWQKLRRLLQALLPSMKQQSPSLAGLWPRRRPAGRKRRRAGRFTAAGGSFVVLVLIIEVIMINISRHSLENWNRLPGTWQRFFQFSLQLDQTWTMFAPEPGRTNSWLVVNGRLSDGTGQDLMRLIPGPPSFERRPGLAADYRDRGPRWFDFYTGLEKALQPGWAAYLCRRFKADYPALSPRQLIEVELYTLYTPLHYPDIQGRLKRKKVFAAKCKPGDS